jgi:hypothetical protein
MAKRPGRQELAGANSLLLKEAMMRMILQVKIPHDKFNVAVKDGTAGAKMKKILDETKPEAVYFTEYGGQRGAILIVDLKDASRIPFYTEPWFLTFNADCQFHVVMSPEDLGKAGLDALGKKWA